MDQTSRRAPSGGAATASTNSSKQQSTLEPIEPTTRSTKLVFGLSSRTNRVKHDEYAESRRNFEKPKSEMKQQATDSAQQVNGSARSQEPSGRERPKIRASKYGNFYKPQDLTQPQPQPQQQQQPQPVQAQDKKEVNMKPQVVAGGAESATSGASEQPKKARASSKSPVRKKSVDNGGEDRRAKPVRRKSIGEKDAPIKEKPIEVADPPKPQRMHFNTPPPPPKLSNSAKGSVVSYAKSRIYDRPTNRFGFSSANANLTNANGSLELNADQNVSIPKSILSGFKPPKQINVSKAREKWEGGEPFARCKSRQRLAAQAGKKLLHGTWSMTSVVATQQLHLQQALAASSPRNNPLSASGYLAADPSVKVLTRGSVLERVQQFERVPSATIGSSLPGSSSSSVGSGSGSGSSTPTSADSWDSSSGSQSSDDGGDCELGSRLSDSSDEITLKSNGDQSTSPISPTASRQAQYKHKILSQQQHQQQPNDFVSNLLGSSTLQSAGSKSPPVSSPSIESELAFFAANGQQRRPSLRRRSSVVSSTSSQSSSNIPKFYHPNGKPNTYEIELQKKNIVACFDKFPDRQASLTGPNARRHFHSIALACSFSEYFKEPLCAYIKHQLCNSNLLHNASAGAMLSRLSRKQSTTASPIVDQPQKPETKPKEQQQVTPGSMSMPPKRPLARAASIDTSTMEKLASQNFVTCEQFLICWLHMINVAFDKPAQFVYLLTFGQRQYLVPDDFVPLIQSIIEDHPGLKFLRAAPDFHMRYIQTVIARIYFCLNKSWTGKLSLKELRSSNLLAVLQVLSQEDDINQITDYFSYEHFYVIYCKFWNLDQDHDLLISKEDLAKHNDAAISSRVIERIFSGVVSRQVAKTGKMSYTDFVWFLIAEEDKKHPRSIEYWFRVLDIDGDGFISMYEMEYFYHEQIRRLELMNIEALPFLDSACQILDLVNPREKNKISLSDLKRTKMATIFFDTFINLEKYLEHESREFVSTRDVVQGGVVISDWDRYASEEYENLVTEESSV